MAAYINECKGAGPKKSYESGDKEKKQIQQGIGYQIAVKIVLAPQR